MTRWSKSVYWSRPASWYPAETTTDHLQITGAGITLSPTQTGGNIVIDSMHGLTDAVAAGQVTLQSVDSAGNTISRVIEYPVFGDVTAGSNIRFDAGTTAADFDTTFYGYVFDPLASRKYARRTGRTLHRTNHRGLAPRAVSVDFSKATPAEITALQLLRGLVGQDEFRRYLKYGFVMVRGASGLRYQIGRKRHIINVWIERGRVDGICVYLTGNFPPTDDVITRMLMAERDELELWKRGNSRTGRNATPAKLERLYLDGRRAVAA